jgi:uncharacterized SAM-binding protein YcdF (DUF218 family)
MNSKTDAVIVLANLMSQTGELNAESAARAIKAVEVFHELDARFLVTCGWAYREDSPINISDALKSYIVSRFDLPADVVLSETGSRDTVGDAVFSKVKYALPLGWRRICVVTSQYHVARTREIFSFVYGDAYEVSVVGAEVAEGQPTEDGEASSIAAFRQTFVGIAPGDDSEIFERLQTQHPFYNGVIHPQI